MSLEKIVAGDYGQEVKLTINDVDTGSAADVSSYSSTIEMVLTDPSGNDAKVTAAFDTDGTDGVVAYTLQDGDIDEAGKWQIRARVASGSAVLTSEAHTFTVLVDASV